VVPKKIAVKYDPPMIGIEYYLKSIGTDFLLKIDLKRSLEVYDDPMDILKWIFTTYGDIVDKSIVSEKQVITIS
jgi:hypothetical protein